MDNGHKTGPSKDSNGDTKTEAVAAESSDQQPTKRKCFTITA